jgi:hypothetical protein
MKILLDHCIDWRLRRSLSGHDVSTAQEMGRDELKNGKLLAAAAASFDLLLTVDQNIKSEQNLAPLPVAVVVLIGPSNRLVDLTPLIPVFERAASSLVPNQLIEIRASGITRITA